MKRVCFPVLLAAAACAAPDVAALRESDLEGARAAFLANLAAIQERDTERYLAGYLRSDELLALSPAGMVTGYATLAAARRADAEWPDSLAAGAPTLVWLAPGVVYGAYEYVAVQGGTSSTGWSERVLVKTTDGWRIAVTSAIPATP